MDKKEVIVVPKFDCTFNTAVKLENGIILHLKKRQPDNKKERSKKNTASTSTPQSKQRNKLIKDLMFETSSFASFIILCGICSNVGTVHFLHSRTFKMLHVICHNHSFSEKRSCSNKQQQQTSRTTIEFAPLSLIN